ncbi:MAG: TonB-dependent receptor [Pseudomonadota bacterium]
MSGNVTSRTSNTTQIFSRNKLGIAVSAAVAGLPAAHAQEQELELEEIVVTATKRAVSLQDIPVTVTAIGEEEITFQRMRNFSDYVGQIPSLALSDRQPGAQSVIMRGCAAQGLSFADSATTSIYLDEQPITSSGFNPDPRLIDVARVEALAGPQGTLFGDAAQCGTLRIITNKPDSTQSSSWVDLTAMSITDGDSGFDVSAMTNIPLIENKVALRLVGFIADEPGWVDNVLSASPGEQRDNAAFAGEDVNSSTWSGGRAMLRFNPNDQWTIDVGAIFQNYELDGFGDADLNQQNYADTGAFPTFGERDQVRFNDEFWQDEWYQTSITIEGNLDFGNIIFTGSYFDRDSEYLADSSVYLNSFQQIGDYIRSLGPYYESQTIYDFGGDPDSTNFDVRDTTVTSLELRYSTPDDTDSRWSAIVGGFYSQREVSEVFIANIDGLASTPGFSYINYLAYSYYGVALSSGSENWFSGFYDSELTQWAVFGEATFDLTENLSITAGGRFYNIENEYVNQRAQLVRDSGGIPDCTVDYCLGQSEPGVADEDGFVPKISAAYRFGESDNLVYGIYSEGFRRGGANSARPQSVFGPPGRFPAPAGTLSEYESDTVQNYELGFKLQSSDNRLRFNTAIYMLTWDDIQIQATDPTGTTPFPGVVNFPEAEINGFEAWLSWLPSDYLSVEATIGINDGELSEDGVLFEGTVGELPISQGVALPIVPDVKGSLNVTVNLPTEFLGATPYIFASYNYTGESVNSLDGVEPLELATLFRTQSSYSTLDLQTGIDNGTWSATLFVDNVTDEAAELFFNNRWTQQRLSTNQPRTFGVNFRYNFGGN